MGDDTDLDAASASALANMARVRPVLDKIADKWTILILTGAVPSTGTVQRDQAASRRH